jgi:hypothetical protein
MQLFTESVMNWRSGFLILTLLSQKYIKQTPWPLVREQTIPTDRPPLVDEI